MWPTDRIVRINPETGCVTAWIDLSGLRSFLPAEAVVDALNGIAYDAQYNYWSLANQGFSTRYSGQGKP